MESKKVRRQFHSEDFILKVLRDYYSSGKSKYFIRHRYAIGTATFLRWQRKYDLAGKAFSLSRAIINKVKYMRKEAETSAKSREEDLERQVANLRKSLDYSELRNQGFMKAIEICSNE